jgi:hypothetical protein
MEKIPTAEFFRGTKLMDSSKPYTEEEIMIEFAKLHVEAALKAKVEQMKEKSYEDSSYSMNELDSFTRDSYPLENIK